MPAPTPEPLGQRTFTSLRSFASADRFIAEATDPSRRRPGYVLAGDDLFLQDRCRRAILDAYAPVPGGLRDLCLHELDLADTSIFEALDRAQTPSLLAPFQVLILRGLKHLYTRGSKKEEFAAIDQYFRSPNPQALLVFVADHLRIPNDLRRMDMQDKERYERIRETLGDVCGIVDLARVEEADAARWAIETAGSRGVRFDPDAARELVDALGTDMMLVASETEKLLLYATAPRVGQPPSRVPHPSQSEGWDAPATPPGDHQPRISLGTVETMVLAAKQRSLYDLTDAITARDRPRAVALLHGLLNASDGGEDAAIGHLYLLARTFRQMLIIVEKNARDTRALWTVLWQGFRMPPFAAEDLIRQARRYRSRRDLTRALRLIARADLDLRSSPADKRLVLERLVLALATEPKASSYEPAGQFAIEL